MEHTAVEETDPKQEEADNIAAEINDPGPPAEAPDDEKDDLPF